MALFWPLQVSPLLLFEKSLKKLRFFGRPFLTQIDEFFNSFFTEGENTTSICDKPSKFRKNRPKNDKNFRPKIAIFEF